MRPASIVNFERVVLLMLALGLLNTALNWNQVEVLAARRGFDSNVILGAYAAALALFLLVVWLTSRKASVAAMWIYVVIVVASVAIELYGLFGSVELPAMAMAASVAQFILAAISLWLLFRPDARAWFAARSDAGAP